MKTKQMIEAERLFNTTDMPVSEIASTLGLHVSTIYTWVKKFGWETNQIRDWSRLRADAQILYIKHGYTIKAISEQIDISPGTIAGWSKQDNWDRFRPDLEVMNEYKAAGMYVLDEFSASDISQYLNIPEITVKMWIDLNRWDVTRLLYKSRHDICEMLIPFQSHFTKLFPHLEKEIEFAMEGYLKSITPIKS